MSGLRHISLITFAGVAEPVVDEIVAALEALPAAIPAIARYTVGRDLGLQEGNATVAVVGDFASADDYRIYAAHPAHVAVLDNHIRPHMTALTRTQIPLSS
ncbi:MAG: Dabb family protein [Acidimicrobiales bacterium]